MPEICDRYFLRHVEAKPVKAAVKTKIARIIFIAILGGTVAVLFVEGYGKLYVAGDVPHVIGKQLLGGAWTFKVNVTGTAQAFRIIEPLDFDADRAQAELEAAYNLSSYEPQTTFDLTDGL